MNKPRMAKPTAEEAKRIVDEAGSSGNPALYPGDWCDADELRAWRASQNTSCAEQK